MAGVLVARDIGRGRHVVDRSPLVTLAGWLAILIIIGGPCFWAGWLRGKTPTGSGEEEARKGDR